MYMYLIFTFVHSFICSNKHWELTCPMNYNKTDLVSALKTFHNLVGNMAPG